MVRCLYLPFLLLLLMVSGLVNGQPTRSGSFMERGLQAFQSANYPEALNLFNMAASETPPAAGLFEYRGYVLFVLGRYAEADRDFSFAIEQGLKTLQPVAGEYRIGNMTLIEPGAERNAASLAALYNNRGVTRLSLGRKDDALRDFSRATELNPQLVQASQNLSYAQTGRFDPFNNPTQPSFSTSAQAAFTPYPRPVSPGVSPVAAPRETSLALRRSRVAEYEAKATGKPVKGLFVLRRVRRSITYQLPIVAAKSESYLRLESVQITSEATIVTVTVENPETRNFKVNVADPGQPDAFFLTDRDGRRRMALRQIREGIAKAPFTTDLPSLGKITFTLEFERIPDDIGFVNLIEGNKADGWNFYMIDLTKR